MAQLPRLVTGGYAFASWLHSAAAKDFPGLVLSTEDFHELELAAVLLENEGPQSQIQRVWGILEQWHEERVARPARVQRRREALSRTKLRAGSRARVLKREKPSWQRRGGRETKRFRWRETRPLPSWQLERDLAELRAKLAAP